MIYERNNRKISQQVRHFGAHKYNGSCSCLWTLQVVVSGRYNFSTKLAFITLLPYYPTVDKFITPLALPSTNNGQSLPARISRGQDISVNRMDFVESFLAIKPEVLFQKGMVSSVRAHDSSSHTPPTTFLIITATICFIVLVMFTIFLIGVCQLCRSTPADSDESESVTLVEQPV